MAEATAARTQQATAYVVLEKTPAGPDGGVAWIEAGQAESATKQGAITQIAGDKEGVWRAVPLRSWQGAVQTKTEKITRTRAEVLQD